MEISFSGTGQYEEALSQYDMALQIAAELESAEEICFACHSNRAYMHVHSIFVEQIKLV
jgi:hypothetical protein